LKYRSGRVDVNRALSIFLRVRARSLSRHRRVDHRSASSRGSHGSSSSSRGASYVRSFALEESHPSIRRDAIATPVCTRASSGGLQSSKPEIGTNSRGREEGTRSRGVFARPSRRPLLLASWFTCESAIMPEPDDGKATLDSGQLASGRVSGRETPRGSVSLRLPPPSALCSTTFGWCFSRRDSD